MTLVESLGKSVFYALTVCSLLFILIPPLHASSQAPLVLGVIQSESDYYGRFVRLIYQEAFRRLGRHVEIRYFPAKRSSFLVRAKRIDGDLARTVNFHKQHPNLAIVPEAPFEVYIKAFSASPTLKISDWQDLRETKYRVDYLRGSAMIDIKRKEGRLQDPISQVNDWKTGLRKLFAGRSDLFVEFEGGVRYAMAKPEFQGKWLFEAGTLDVYSVHAFLQPEHKELAHELAQVLRNMKYEGVIDQFKKQALNSNLADHFTR